MNRGKTRVGTIRTGWRSVRVTERRASSWTWPRKSGFTAHAGGRQEGSAAQALDNSRLRWGGFLGRALERATRLGEKHVVQGWRMQLHIRHANGRGVECPDNVGEIV